MSDLKTLINEYEEQRKKTKAAEGTLEEKKRKIADVKWYGDFDHKYQRPSDKCVGQCTTEFLSYDEWRYKDEITEIEYCPNFEKIDGCKKTECPGYQNYINYLDAKQKHETEDHKLWNYPLHVMIAAYFKRKFNKNR